MQSVSCPKHQLMSYLFQLSATALEKIMPKNVNIQVFLITKCYTDRRDAKKNSMQKGLSGFTYLGWRFVAEDFF